MNIGLLQGEVISKSDTKEFNNGDSLTRIKIRTNGVGAADIEAQLWNETSSWCRDAIEPGAEVLLVGRLKESVWEDRQSGEQRHRLVFNVMEMIPTTLVNHYKDRQIGREEWDGDDY